MTKRSLSVWAVVAAITAVAWAHVPSSASSPSGGNVRLDAQGTTSGFVALLLINESPFPGERGWVSEADTRASMLAILWVLHSRIHHIPTGYRQEHIATVRTSNILDVITAGGVHGQCEGFYRNSDGRCVAVRRVHERIAYLLRFANKGKPGRFARLLGYAQGLSRAYARGGVWEADRFARLRQIGRVSVTGRAYSWMTNQDCYHPGGTYIRIPDQYGGCLGGNRFFTLRKHQ
jgi:hypothetical protein